jgi:hypothetical protein
MMDCKLQGIKAMDDPEKLGRPNFRSHNRPWGIMLEGGRGRRRWHWSRFQNVVWKSL